MVVRGKCKPKKCLGVNDKGQLYAMGENEGIFDSTHPKTMGVKNAQGEEGVVGPLWTP